MRLFSRKPIADLSAIVMDSGCIKYRDGFYSVDCEQFRHVVETHDMINLVDIGYGQRLRELQRDPLSWCYLGMTPKPDALVQVVMALEQSKPNTREKEYALSVARFYSAACLLHGFYLPAKLWHFNTDVVVLALDYMRACKTVKNPYEQVVCGLIELSPTGSEASWLVIEHHLQQMCEFLLAHAHGRPLDTVNTVSLINTHWPALQNWISKPIHPLDSQETSDSWLWQYQVSRLYTLACLVLDIDPTSDMLHVDENTMHYMRRKTSTARYVEPNVPRVQK